MFLTTLISVLFGITAIQACSKTNLLVNQDKLPCLIKLDSYRAITEMAGKKYEEYYKQLETIKLSADDRNDLEINHKKFQQMISQVLADYKDNVEEVKLISNGTVRMKVCQKYLSLSMKNNRMLERLAKNIKDDLLQHLKKAGLHNDRDPILDKINQIEKKVFDVINILFMIDMSYKIGKGVWNFYKWSTNVEEGLVPIEESVSNVQEFTGVFQEVISEDLGVEETEAVRNEISELLELETGEEATQAIEAARAAEAAQLDEAASSAEALRATEMAESASVEGAEATELVGAARLAHADRAAEAARAYEATRTAEIARVGEATRMVETTAAEASEGIEGTLASVAEGIEVAEGAALVGTAEVGEAVGGPIVMIAGVAAVYKGFETVKAAERLAHSIASGHIQKKEFIFNLFQLFMNVL